MNCEWATPQDLFDSLNKEFHFTLDPCCTIENAKCERFYTKAEDGLSQDWTGETVFMNPPYSRSEMPKWIQRAYESSLAGSKVVCLLPAKTDTRWFHDFCLKGEIRFIKGRICFGSGEGRAPFPSMVVIFNGAK
ncbi:DNA N-6-adenine-methyltransferase [Desulfatibacillum aliphaticivorans]|uniref:DNA N-6-adenine-methyltransferase n=1 Tax=Desulfatibacillum aliphaticivorans TaxID=218208 RepID=B8FNL1_DESAL|nr:DNA N-6-adenine-methyltransferase [Desulfatibacillum aliphaticivorans]